MSIDLPLYRPDPADGRVDMAEFEQAVLPTRSRVNPELWARIWFILFVTAVAYFVHLAELGRTAAGGSQAAYLVVAPVLAGLVAAGYSRAPRGVIDAESDWIAAALLCIGGFAAIILIQHRLPTMAALWHLDNLGLLVWVAACGTVVFSARHVLRMWNVWILGLVLAPVMPFMLVTAQFGGSDTAIAMVSAAIGTIAVYLASRFVSLRVRLAVTLANMVASTATVLLLGGVGLYVTVLIAAGAVPVVVVLALHRITWVRSDPDIATSPLPLPSCRPQSYAVLVVAALVMLCIQLPLSRPEPVADAAPGWVDSSGLTDGESFDFITRFLGPDASLVRYRVTARSDAYDTVVDVMTSPDLGRLQDFSDAVWYPSAVPVNYAPFDAGADAPAGIRSAHSDADAATTSDTPNWDAVTWVWRSGDVYQRVTVLTSQTRNMPAPAPQPLSVRSALIEPALWTLRQQPSDPGAVNPLARADTEAVVDMLLHQHSRA
ncbi:hypothetical protein MMUR_15740 [Mycolicibacterium murale]|jgi:hypothetical protein|uniref:Uncharacterized protein n=1 Tax=Mycolicibacterium murale TaxID=182220 RepID=A0A7I9WJ96_9MYCO|nr:hypothetical protein [Mycolicibacterium murale]ANW66555.1 hypothetical protein BCA37_25940 [Mycobacterium sp. djl-10]MCV7184090.1 hypothetical protein [Mycolicibacterium murale]GFG57438.1 hypothetical protein MMUR_15740 [Mycolicibacterium murale]